VPAWDEARALPRTLLSLAAQSAVRADVVVVANGCNDPTVEVALSFASVFEQRGHRLRVVELQNRSKTAALNLGDELLELFPRAYMDADVALGPNSLVQVCQALANEQPRLASPALRFVTSDPSRTRRIANFLQSTPPFSTDVVGGGFYAVNKAGRDLWKDFPEVIADDTYVCSLFPAATRIRIERAYFEARFPAEARMIDVMARWEAGRRQLRHLGVRLERRSAGAKVKAMLRKPALLPLGIEYVLVKFLASLRARTHSNRPWARADLAT
jgi:glycosyltransferase involved in cell wall biosynthesis